MGPLFYHCMSLLLDYPDGAARAAWPALAAALETLPVHRRPGGIATFLSQAASRPPLELEEAYTAAFDTDPATTLNMTYHLWRDSEKRAGALVRLNQLYRDAGYEAATGELPDYLPLMLEFIAVVPEARGHDIVRACFRGLGDLSERVRPKAPAYGALLALLDDALRNAGDEMPAGRPEEGRAAAAPPRSPSWN